MRYKLKFYLLMLKELCFLPYFYLANYYKWKWGRYDSSKLNLKFRNSIQDPIISVCIHEWGGYDKERSKLISEGKSFRCGLKFQLERFKAYTGPHILNVVVTVSDSNLLSYSLADFNHLLVPNEGMDFSGYGSFFETIKHKKNHYVILTNSSVNSIQGQFLNQYIEYMEENKTVGLLGTSYSTKIYQSFIKNNFNPHIQSFFLLTTTDIIKEVIAKTNSFPGKNISNKLLLIREGEVKFSDAILDIGYELASVLEDGTVYKFNKEFKKDNGHKSWSIKKGDYRMHTKNPNSINLIKK